MDITAIQKVELDPAKLQAARGERSPSEVARLLGITYQQLWQIENGSRNPSAPILVKLCFLYGVDIKDIVSGENFLQAA
jgi:transcriptional regulator with XRE-family HTH domain